MSETFFRMTCHERHRLYRINATNDGDFVGFIWFDEDCNAWVFELINNSFNFTAPELQEILEFMQRLEGAEQ
jgi:hypothetical protein